MVFCTKALLIGIGSEIFPGRIRTRAEVSKGAFSHFPDTGLFESLVEMLQCFNIENRMKLMQKLLLT